MNKVVRLITISLLFIICVLFYLKYDSKGYEYGFDCNFCDKKIPYNLEPKVDRYYTFALFNDEGFELLGKGFSYQYSSFKINNLLGYGYNDTSVIVKCTDSLNNIKYLFSYETKYKNSKGNPEISFKDLEDVNFQQINASYIWTELDEEKGDKIRLYKTLSLIGIIISLLLGLISIFRLKKRKATH